jgi:hypothetical protein
MLQRPNKIALIGAANELCETRISCIKQVLKKIKPEPLIFIELYCMILTCRCDFIGLGQLSVLILLLFIVHVF